MDARCETMLCGRASLKSRQERLGRCTQDDVDVDGGDIRATARFLDVTPVPVSEPPLVYPPYKDYDDQTANVHAILQPECDFRPCLHYNAGTPDELVVVETETG